MRGRVLVSALLCLLPTSAWADPLKAVVQEAVVRVAGTADVKGRKLGTGEFRLTDGRLTQLGVYLSDHFEVALVQRAAPSGFAVVTRNELCQVIRENKLWVKDYFDPALPRKLGRLADVDLLLSGRLADLGGQIVISVRLVDTESGKSVWADSLNIPSDPELKRLLTRPAISDPCLETASTSALPSVTPEGTLQVKVWTDKPRYRIGETVRFEIKTNGDAYITVVDIGTDGRITILFPGLHQNL